MHISTLIAFIIAKKMHSELRGRKFKGKTSIQKIDGKLCEIERICQNCYYGTIEENQEIKYTGKCSKFEANMCFGEQPLKIEENILLKQPLPAKLDGKEVGNYCLDFTYFNAFKQI